MNKLLCFLLVLNVNILFAQTALTNTFTYQGELKFFCKG